MPQLRVATRAEWRSYAGGVAHLRGGRGRDEEESGERAKHLSVMVAQSIKMDFDESATSRAASAVNGSL